MQSIDGTKKRKKGRPAVDSEAVNLRVPRDLVDALDEYRRQQQDLPNRQEAIRRILRDALALEPEG